MATGLPTNTWGCQQRGPGNQVKKDIYQNFLIYKSIDRSLRWQPLITVRGRERLYFNQRPSHSTDEAVGDPLRLSARLLRQDSFGVLELCKITDTPQSGMSHHLRILSDANLVERRKEGTSIFYRRTTKTPHAALEPLTQTLFQTIDQMPLSFESQTRERYMESVVVVQRHSSKHFTNNSKTTKNSLPNSPNTASVFQISSSLRTGIQKRLR